MEFTDLADGFFDLAKCAATHNCSSAVKEVTAVIKKWTKKRIRRVVGTGLSLEHWKALFEISAQDERIRKIVMEWVEAINAEVPHGEFSFGDPLLPYLTMSNLRGIVGFQGVIRMSQLGVSNQEAFVKRLLEPNQVVKWGIDGHTIFLNSYGVDESKDGEAEDNNGEESKEKSDDMSDSIARVSDKVGRLIGKNW